MAIREGRWDCASCGSRAIQGRHVDCPGCGRPRPAGTRFYLTDDAPVVTDAEQLAEARSGPDWACAQCAATNRAALTSCGGCGAPREATPSPSSPRGTPSAPPPPHPRAGGSGWKRPGLRAWVVAAGVLVWFVAAVADEWKPRQRAPELVPAVVESVAWEHGVVVEERRLVPDSGRTLADSAVEVDTGRVVDGHRQEVERYEMVSRRVPRYTEVVVGHRNERRWVEDGGEYVTTTTTCGTRDLGNGYFEDKECTETRYVPNRRRETVRVPVTRTDTTYETVTERQPVYRTVPVYVPFYRYRRVEWVPVDTVRAAGDTARPSWPAVVEVPGRREGSRMSNYYVTARDSTGRVHRAWVSPGDPWPPYRIGQGIAITPATDGLMATPHSADDLPACRRWRRGKGDPPPARLGCTRAW